MLKTREHARDAVAHKVLGGELAHLAGAEDEDRAPLEGVEHTLGKLDGSVRDRHRVLADVCLRPHSFADFEALSEQLVEDPSASAAREGLLVGLFHLSEDLRLAHDHRVERSDNTK